MTTPDVTEKPSAPAASTPASGYGDLVKQEAVMLELCWMVATPEQRAAVRRDAPDAIKAMEECLGRPLKESP
jgi:hypothetical protein